MSSRQILASLSTRFPVVVERLFSLINVGLLVAIALSIWPYLASAFYLYQGSNMLEKALKEQGLESSEWEVIIFASINRYSNGLKAKLDSSAAYLQRAIRWDVNNAQAHNSMAKVLYLQGHHLLAIDALSQVNELRPQNPLVHLTIGDLYDGLGLAEEAIAEYERSQMELRGSSVGERAEVNYLKLADAYLRAGDPNRALPVLQKILKIDPYNPYALYHLAKICETMGEGERLLAQGLYEQLHALQIPTWGDKRLYGYFAELVPQLVEEEIWSQEKALRAIAFLVFRDLPAEARAIGDSIGTYPEESDLYLYQGLDTIPEGWRGEVLVIESFDNVTEWWPRQENNVSEGRFASDGYIADMSYLNNVTERDIFAFVLSLDVDIGEFGSMALRFKATPDTLWTMEIVVDGERSRPISYRPGNGAWEIVEVPLRGYRLQEVLLSIGELDNIEKQREYRMSLDWIALR